VTANPVFFVDLAYVFLVAMVGATVVAGARTEVSGRPDQVATFAGVAGA
jgi:hypothetical protein